LGKPLTSTSGGSLLDGGGAGSADAADAVVGGFDREIGVAPHASKTQATTIVGPELRRDMMFLLDKRDSSSDFSPYPTYVAA
jgi:hypothetical protein